LFVASQQGHCDVVKCLLSSGADINVCDKDGQSPLFIASHQGHCDVVKCLLSSGAVINLSSSRTLISAPELSKRLTTSQRPSSDAANNGDCTRSLHKYGHCDVVKCLLSNGANINLCSERGQSPLFVASQQGHCDVVKCLLSSGADINLRNNLGQTPMYVACNANRTKNYIFFSFLYFW
jgi:ankyrin repeat protein